MKRTMTAVAATVLLVLTLPPLALFAGSVSWPRMAEIGDAYGGVAAVISALALIGVAASLLLQWRQARLEQLIAMRQHHFELIKLGLEHPGLLVFEPYAKRPRDSSIVGYANLWVAFWALQWDLKVLSESQLRAYAGPLFELNPFTIEWWQASAATWSTKPTASRRRFQAILTEECEQAANRNAG